MESLSDRLINNRVISPDGCWLWTGHVVKSTGYGRLTFRGKTVSVHRSAHELWIGPIPEGLHVDHLCRVRTCMNPAHLEAVTQLENNRRAWAAHFTGKVHACGHPKTAGGPCPTCREARLAARAERAAKAAARVPAPRPAETGVRKCGHPYLGPGDCPECARQRAARYREQVRTGQVAPPRTIICTECQQERQNCAKGMCRRCYTRLYKRATYVPASHRASAPDHSSKRNAPS